MIRLRRASAKYPRRITLFVCLLLMLLPPGIAMASDLYASGTCHYWVHEGGQTPSTYVRNYNDVYHPTNTAWTVYSKDPAHNIVAEHYSISSPTHLGSSGGAYRYSRCIDYDTDNEGGSYSCYTTRP